MWFSLTLHKWKAFTVKTHEKGYILAKFHIIFYEEKEKWADAIPIEIDSHKKID